LDADTARSRHSRTVTTEERRRVLDDVENVEPLLRRAGRFRDSTTMPLDEVVTAILRLVDR